MTNKIAGAPGRSLGEAELSRLRPTWLLDHARQLAERTSSDSPRSVHARRAISAAYYAIFHRVCINIAWTVVPNGNDTTRWALCRTVDHRPLREVAAMLLAKNPPSSVTGLVAMANQAPGLQALAQAFNQLQQDRHSADYDHLRVFGRTDAEEAVREARALHDAVQEVFGTPAWSAFTTLVLLKSTILNR